MTGWSNGNSFGASVGDGLALDISSGGAVRWPVPPWKFGLRLSDDRGDI